MNLLCRPLVPLLLLGLFPCLPTALGEEYKPLSMAQRFDQLERDLKQPDKHTAIKCAEEAIAMVRGVAVDGSMRKQNVKWWLRLIQTIRSHEEPNFDWRRDPPSENLIPPMDSGRVQFPSGVSPEAITDPIAREKYIAALKKNEEKAQRVYFQLMLPRQEMWATWYFKQYLNKWYADTAEDQEEIDGILSEAGVTEAKKKEFKAAIGKWDGRFSSKP